MKFAASLLFLSVLGLTACNNLVTRRDLYAPAKASGPYTQARRTGKLPPKNAPVAKSTPKPGATLEHTENPLPQ